MIHTFPYKEFDPVDVPDANVAGVYSLSEPSKNSKNSKKTCDAEIVRAALDNPIGTGKLVDEVSPGMKVLIAVDDNSRNTRTELMLPMILNELLAAGTRKEDVTVFIALGTHRPMTDTEMCEKYTADVVHNYHIVNPDWRDDNAYVTVGESKRGFPVKVHREILNADYVIGVGQTIPHMIAGFGGGSKIICPGCSDGDTIGEMHWMCSEVPQGELFAVRNNAVRDVIDEVAAKAGLKFILNEVPSSTGIAGAFAGHPVQAHMQACEFAQSVCEVKISEKADIVLADAYPADIDFWQALKGLNAAYGAVKDGGTVILVTTCPEGTSSQHDEVTKYGYSPQSCKIMAMVDSGEIDKAVGANLLLGHQLLNKAGTILVTKGISQADTKAMGYDWAQTPADAIQMALTKHGPAATINILYKASKMICTAN